MASSPSDAAAASAAIASSTPRRPMAASSSAASSSSVVILKPEDLLDTADSATVDSRTRWPEAAGTKSTLVADQLRQYSTGYRIPEQYALLNAGDWVACDVPPDGYNIICVYAAAFKAGMRLPFHSFHAVVLGHYGLAPSQLMPNAWRYLNAFVLLCEDAQVQPMLPVFRCFFDICRDKGESMGRYHFRPCRCPLSPADSSRHCRLFTGKMPHSPWKDRFFFIKGPSWMPWPCSLKWGTPSRASVQEPVLTTDVSEAIHRLLRLAGDTGIDIMKFLSGRNPPVGHLQVPVAATPQCVAVKQEANAAAVAATASTEQTRKRKSPEPITSVPPLSLQIVETGYDDQWTESPPAHAGVGLGHGEEPTVTGDERSDSWMLLHFAEVVTARLEGKKQEVEALNGDLQMVTAEVVRLEEVLAGANAQHAAAVVQHEEALKAANTKLEVAKAQHEAANTKLEAANTKHAADLDLLKDDLNTKHAADLAQLKDAVQKEKQAEASRYAEELHKATQDAYDKGRRDMKKHLVDRLLSDSSPPPTP